MYVDALTFVFQLGKRNNMHVFCGKVLSISLKNAVADDSSNNDTILPNGHKSPRQLRDLPISGRVLY